MVEASALVPVPGFCGLIVFEDIAENPLCGNEEDAKPPLGVEYSDPAGPDLVPDFEIERAEPSLAVVIKDAKVTIVPDNEETLPTRLVDPISIDARLTMLAGEDWDATPLGLTLLRGDPDTMP